MVLYLRTDALSFPGSSLLLLVTGPPQRAFTLTWWEGLFASVTLRVIPTEARRQAGLRVQDRQKAAPAPSG